MADPTDPEPGVVPAREEAASDRSLLRRLRLGSQDAATQLYLRYAQRLLGLARARCSPDLARRIELEDVVQSVFGSFFRGAASGFYDVPEGEDLWKLFLVIALNKIRAKGNFHRAAKRDVRLTRGSEALDNLDERGADDESALAFLRVTIDDALERLPEPQRQVVALRIEGFEVAEIADRVGRSKRTVERTLQEARRQLDHLLQDEGNDGHDA